MVHIEVSGPTHSKKGYIMAVIAQALREAGAEVRMLGESTHLADKMVASPELVHEKLDHQVVHITEMQTGV